MGIVEIFASWEHLHLMLFCSFSSFGRGMGTCYLAINYVTEVIPIFKFMILGYIGPYLNIM